MSNPTELPDLLPCPFCGGDAKFDRVGNWHDLVVAHLDDCLLSGDAAEMSYLDSPGVQDRMASKWNRRAQPEVEASQAVEQYRLTIAGSPWYDMTKAIKETLTEPREGYEFRTLYTAPAAPAATLSPLCGAQHAESDDIPISRSTYGSLEACEAEYQRRQALAAQLDGGQEGSET